MYSQSSETQPEGATGGPRRVACVTTSRADSGIYRPLLAALSRDSHREVFCLAGGTHLSELFGRTIDHLADLPGVTLEPVEHFVAGDAPAAVAANAGRAVEAFAASITEVEPDLVFVLGDRTEMLAAALAALICRVPIAHLHGGDQTLGAYDDQCRHAITKLSHVHLPALPEHADRIVAMGEASWRVHAVGALALDELRRFEPEPIASLNAAIGLDIAEPTIIVVLHPETLSDMPPEEQARIVLSSLADFEGNLVLAGPNADVGHEAFAASLRQLSETRAKTVLVQSLSQKRFWSCLTYAHALVGNSSAGMLESASFGLPVVNIGDRQAGRVRASNVIDAAFDSAEIRQAISRALSATFREGLHDMVNPYGDGRTAERILRVLASLPDRGTLLRKGQA